MPAAPGANGRICLRLKRRKQTLFFDVRPSDTIRSVATRIALIHNPNSAEEVVPRDASEVSICAIKDKNKLWGEGNAIAGLEIEADRTIEAINAAEYDVLLYRLWQRPEGSGDGKWEPVSIPEFESLDFEDAAPSASQAAAP